MKWMGWECHGPRAMSLGDDPDKWCFLHEDLRPCDACRVPYTLEDDPMGPENRW